MADPKPASPPTPLDALKAQTEMVNAEKALADAQKDLATSQAQAAVAQRVGPVTAGPFTGVVNMKDKAGTQEAQLLAARAVRMAAERIVTDVLARTTATTLCLFPAAQAPTFGHLMSYRLRSELVHEAFDNLAKATAPVEHAAAPAPDPAHGGTAQPRFVGGFAVASAGLDAATKLLDFFRTDYEVGGAETTVDDAALLYAVAGALRRPRNPPAAAPRALLPLTDARNDTEAALRAIIVDLRPLAGKRADIAHAIVDLQAQISTKQTEATDPKNTANHAAALAAVELLKARLAPYTAVATQYDGFVTFLSTPDANGVAPIATITQELAIETILKRGADVLLLHLESTGGGYLIKKNLLTALGSMPLYHTGGATATYLLLSGPEGEALGGDIVPVYGGFIRSEDLAGTLARS
jgi:hypothetical protein